MLFPILPSRENSMQLSSLLKTANCGNMWFRCQANGSPNQAMYEKENPLFPMLTSTSMPQQTLPQIITLLPLPTLLRQSTPPANLSCSSYQDAKEKRGSPTKAAGDTPQRKTQKHLLDQNARRRPAHAYRASPQKRVHQPTTSVQAQQKP